MATKSFLKTIHIKNKKDCHALVNALEHAKDKSAVSVSFHRSYHVASKEEVSNLFKVTK
jgi:hypothetical protein